MTIASISAYLPVSDLIRILAVTLAVALVAPAAVSVAIVGIDRRQSGSTAAGNSLIVVGTGVLLALVALGLYALIAR